MKEEIAIFWFRRDLRLYDNAGLYNALKGKYKILPIFIFDTQILDKLEDKKDRRVHFIQYQLTGIKSQLRSLGSDLFVKYGNPIEIWKELFQAYKIKAIYTNHDYEAYAIERDSQVNQLCSTHNASFFTFKDQCIFEKSEILSGSGTPYTVFTPYSRKWKEKLTDFYIKPYPTEKYYINFLPIQDLHLPSLQEMGFETTDLNLNKPDFNLDIIKNYTANRDIPSIKGTSRLSIHLRFGSVSIRECVAIAKKTNEMWLNELIWRDFYMNILCNFPHINEGKSFRKEYDAIKWRNNEEEFKKWCDGKTGYPIVDAGMRELNATGFMHNRVRMITASFLCKDLLIDWKWGEAYFAKKLNDFDFSANNGGWQWASGSGCDAAPYFRIFNPSAQTERFDKQLAYIKKWIPELNSFEYPAPIVDHKLARERTLKAYKAALDKN